MDILDAIIIAQQIKYDHPLPEQILEVLAKHNRDDIILNRAMKRAEAQGLI